MELVFVAGGVALGAVAALPILVSLRRREAGRIGHGVVAVIAAFAIIQGALLALAAMARDAVAPVGISAVLTFVILVSGVVYHVSRSVS